MAKKAGNESEISKRREKLGGDWLKVLGKCEKYPRGRTDWLKISGKSQKYPKKREVRK